jgi:hypothetical protein
VQGRRSSLPREICEAVPESGLGEPKGNPNAEQKSAEGVVGRKPEGPNGWKASRT